jgi:glycosyltransferase involved in cell wall biosynthesis
MTARLSLAMIVKNEAATLDHCLHSVRDLVDEIIVVDTGSYDNTKDIARRHGSRVFDMPWPDSFAAARNEQRYGRGGQDGRHRSGSGRSSVIPLLYPVLVRGALAPDGFGVDWAVVMEMAFQLADRILTFKEKSGGKPSTRVSISSGQHGRKENTVRTT